MDKDVYKAIRAELKVAQYELEDLECLEELSQLKVLLESIHIEQNINKDHLNVLEKLTKSLWENGFLFEQALVHLDNAHSAMKNI